MEITRILFIKAILFVVGVLVLLFLFMASRKNRKYVKLLGIVGSIYSLVYILWRALFTLPSFKSIEFVFGILLFLAEIMALGQSFVFKMLFSTHRQVDFKPDTSFIDLPSVDIIISTYNEPEDVLARTLAGCKSIDYPQDKLTIYLGDDGQRKSIRLLAKKYGALYVTREDNAHAKAGNINNVLKQSQGEYILLLDADMIPKSNIIDQMIGYFKNSKTGFVQAPQVFYNLDPFQYNLDIGEKVPNEQDFFMRNILEKRALFNATLHVGTNALFRRSAIDAIGGIPTGSITEDMATGMLLQNAGYQSYFIKDTVAVGITAESFEDLLKQRDRWCRGNIQVIKKYNPLKMKGLSFFQKLIYLDGFVYWMFGLQKMIYLLAPLIYLLTRAKILIANPYDLAFLFFPYFISSSLYSRSVSEKSRNTTWGHIYDTAMAPKLAMSFLMEFLFNKQLKFLVTPKGLLNDKDKYKFNLALPHIILFLLSLTAIIINLPHLTNTSDSIYSSLLINLVWCSYNLLGIFVSIFLFLEKRRFRMSERIPVELKVKALIANCTHCADCDYCGNVIDISDTGAKLKIKASCPHFTFSKNTHIKLAIDGVSDVSGTIVRVDKMDDSYVIGLAFDPLSFEAFSNITQYRFDTNNRYVNHHQIDTDMDSFLEIIYKITMYMKQKAQNFCDRICHISSLFQRRQQKNAK